MQVSVISHNWENTEIFPLNITDFSHKEKSFTLFATIELKIVPLVFSFCYNRAMKAVRKLRSKNGGISLLELVLIIALCAMLGFLAMKWFKNRQDELARGDDAMMVTTAEKVAKINSLDGVWCVVHNCTAGHTGTCVHHHDEGYVGYFVHPGNYISGELPEGYNEYPEMWAGENTYYGAEGTMVIKVVAKDGEVTLSWVEGKNISVTDVNNTEVEDSK